jgi:hypothetical protein
MPPKAKNLGFDAEKRYRESRDARAKVQNRLAEALMLKQTRCEMWLKNYARQAAAGRLKMVRVFTGLWW